MSNKVIILIIIAVFALMNIDSITSFELPKWAVIPLGLLVGIVFILLLSPLGKRQLASNPSQPEKNAFFLKPIPGRAYVVMQGGRFAYVVNGDKPYPVEIPNETWFGRTFIRPYRWFVWRTIGYHALIPFFFGVYSFALRHRYTTRDEGGKKIYTPVQETDAGWRSDHVRIGPEIWYYAFGGIEIEGIPFLIKGGATYRIAEDKIRESLFDIQWFEMLDQALNSTVRRVAGQDMTLDKVIGRVAKDIWKAEPSTGDMYGDMKIEILSKIHAYEIETGKKLDDFGVIVSGNDIYDFQPELNPAELTRLQEAALKRQEARGRSLSGQGRAEEKQKVLEAIKDGGDLAAVILNSEAIVDAAANGNLNALIATFIAEKMPKGGK